MTRPLFVDVQDARKYVARINDYSTCEVAAQALALEFDRVRKQGEELASEALLDAYDRGWNAAVTRCIQEIKDSCFASLKEALERAKRATPTPEHGTEKKT